MRSGEFIILGGALLVIAILVGIIQGLIDNLFWDVFLMAVDYTLVAIGGYFIGVGSNMDE